MSKYAVHQTQSQTSGNTKPLRECGERVGHSSNQNCGEGLREAASRPEGGERKRKEALWLFGGRVIPAEDLANAKALGQRAWPARMRLAGSVSKGRRRRRIGQRAGCVWEGKAPGPAGFSKGVCVSSSDRICLTFQQDPAGSCTEADAPRQGDPGLLQPSWGEMEKAGKTGRRIRL